MGAFSVLRLVFFLAFDPFEELYELVLDAAILAVELPSSGILVGAALDVLQDIVEDFRVFGHLMHPDPHLVVLARIFDPPVQFFDHLIDSIVPDTSTD